MLLVAFGAYGYGQDATKYIINTTRLTKEGGLVSNITLCGLQYSRGFIWVGSTE